MKKGFTLIELLAVILILGIIALIAIPTVNNILKEARRGAFSSTLSNIEKAIENECTVSQIKNNEINYTYTITDGIISPSVEIKGNLPDGTIYVDSECKVNYTLYNNNFTGIKNNEETKIEDKKIYTEDILNGAVPVLSNNLIPVTIDDDGTVHKANIYEKWYNYEEKIWANAVILTEAGKIEDDGTILEESIESYFVWIPRYKYKLFNMGNYNSIINEKPTTSNAKEIEIIFENKNVSISIGTEVGQYHSHPAFQAFDSNGLWVAKFEAGENINSLKIKPNVNALRYLDVKTMFESSYNYKRNNDSHMMKNTEWGAVTYLSLSDYGVKGETNVNNNSEFKTGYAATASADQTVVPGVYGNTADITQPYNTAVGYTASTTGNITGVYDMSGGSNELVAGYLKYDENVTVNAHHTGNEKYADTYSGDLPYFGDAMREIGPRYKIDYIPVTSWYNNYAYIIDNHHPWYTRGGDHGDGKRGGILCYYSYGYNAQSHIGTRIVLVK